MKRSILITTYLSMLTFAVVLSSCSKEPIIPVGVDQAKTDAIWVDDSSGGFDFNYTPHGNSGVWNDSTGTNPGGGTNPNDSTGTNPGGGVDPLDSIWFDYTPHGGSGVWDSTWTNPNDTLGGGN